MKTVPMGASQVAFAFPIGTPLRMAGPNYADAAQSYLAAGQPWTCPAMIPQAGPSADIYDPFIVVRPWTGALELQIQAYRKRDGATIEATAYRWNGSSFVSAGLNKAQWDNSVLQNMGEASLTVADLATLGWVGTGANATATPTDGLGAIQITPNNSWDIYMVHFVVSTTDGDPDASIRLFRCAQFPSQAAITVLA
jgi:hypothetical protein